MWKHCPDNPELKKKKKEKIQNTRGMQTAVSGNALLSVPNPVPNPARYITAEPSLFLLTLSTLIAKTFVAGGLLCDNFRTDF